MKKITYLILLVLLFNSCDEQKIIPEVEDSHEIALARDWFEEYTYDVKQRNGSRQEALDIQWNEATSFVKNKIEIVEVPINGKNKRASLGLANSKDIISKLVIFKRGKRYESAVMDIIPMSESPFPNEYFKKLSLKGLDRNYSGLITFYEPISNKLISGYLVKDGLVTKKMSLKLREKSNGRYDCFAVTITYWTCSAYGCNSDSQSYTEYCTYTPDQSVYDQSLDPADTGGGGPGGSDPGETPIELDVNINVDPSITSDPKANCIYNKLLANEKFNEILRNFENNGSLNVTFKLGELPGTINGNTKTSSPFNNIEIIIDLTNLHNHRTVEAARTFLHEAVHAKIYGYMFLNGIRSYEELNEMNFPELWDAYVVAKANGTSPQHELMANMYIDLIAEGLRLFDVRNQNNPEINIDHYRALAWQGL